MPPPQGQSRCGTEVRTYSYTTALPATPSGVDRAESGRAPVQAPVLNLAGRHGILVYWGDVPNKIADTAVRLHDDIGGAARVYEKVQLRKHTACCWPGAG